MGEVGRGSTASDFIEKAGDALILENDHLRVAVLPSLGGKIASIQTKPDGEELLQQALQPYTQRTPYMSFDASDASGWDECLPSIAACEIETASGKVSIPDHGDFWQVAWKADFPGEKELELSADGFSLPLRFSKKLRLEGHRLHVAYSVRNLAKEPVEYVWSAHPLFVIEQGDRILLPASVKEVTVEGSARNRLGPSGTKHAWPHAAFAGFGSSDLSLVGNASDGIGDKLFAAAPQEGWCAIERSRLQYRVELRFDPRELPYLGLWICYGGWPEHLPDQQYCVALEPCTTEGDSLALAIKERRARTLAPGAQDQWSLVFEVSGVL